MCVYKIYVICEHVELFPIIAGIGAVHVEYSTELFGPSVPHSEIADIVKCTNVSGLKFVNWNLHTDVIEILLISCAVS